MCYPTFKMGNVKCRTLYFFSEGFEEVGFSTLKNLFISLLIVYLHLLSYLKENTNFLNVKYD
jgi:hypothetical protein